MAKIISPNYRNRSSQYKWLIRDESEPIEAAKACKRITAENVKFVASREESGFGCYIVGKADQAEGHDFQPDRSEQGSALHFNGRYFEDAKGNAIQAVDSLMLNDDGTIFGKV